MSLFSKANAGLNLTPGERAALKLVQGFILAGLVAALPVLAQLLAAQTINWADVARIAGGTFGVAVLMAVAKWFSAQGDSPLDAPLAAIAENAATQLATATGLNAAKVPLVEPSPVPVADPSAPASA